MTLAARTQPAQPGPGPASQAPDPKAPDPHPRTTRAPVDIIIPTYNERVNLPHAIDSVRAWAANVFVLDSGSTDGTQTIAREMGAQVVEHPWEGYARQKNWAIDNLPLASPWTFILDADETITPALRDEITRITARPPESVREAGFYVNRYLIFMGKKIKHCGYFPSWNLRLFKRGTARYEDRPVHEHMLLQGRPGFLKGMMEHEDRRGLEHYIAKHNRYSTLEAETIFFNERFAARGLKASLFGNAVERKRLFRNTIYPQIPGRWMWRFIWMYVIKLGVLDGPAGLRLCLLISAHELFTTLKLRELELHATRRRRIGPARGWRTDAAQVVPQPPLSAADAREPDNGHATLPHRVTPAAHQPALAAPAPAPLAPGSDPVEPGAGHEPSPWTLRDKLRRAIWMIARAALFRPSFHNWYGWRRVLLRAFGATIGANVRIRPTAQVEIPWNVDLGDHTVVGDYAILYSLGRITLGRGVVISQYAHLCAGTHDYTTPTFPLLRPPIVVQDGAWIAADAFVGPGVTVGARAVVGARATVVKDVPPGQVVAGNPARVVKARSPIERQGGSRPPGAAPLPEPHAAREG